MAGLKGRWGSAARKGPKEVIYIHSIDPLTCQHLVPTKGVLFRDFVLTDYVTISSKDLESNRKSATTKM
jgi:hypothetical protein